MNYPQDYHGAIRHAGLRRVVQIALQYGVHAIIQGHAVAVLVEYTRRKIGAWHIARDIAELREVLGMDEIEKCKWTEDQDGNWWAQCESDSGHILAPNPQNNMRFCCYCGTELVPCSYQETNR